MNTESLQSKTRNFHLVKRETRAMKKAVPPASAVPITDDPTVLVTDDDPLTRGALSRARNRWPIWCSLPSTSAFGGRKNRDTRAWTH
jgi:hypothetical protein